MQRRRFEARRRIQLFIITTVLFLVGVLIVYGQRTGKLTIFGDTATLPGQVTVTDEVDLTKGVSVGDGNATVRTDEAGTWVTIVSGRSIGSAQFDVGNPDIVTLQRFKPLPTPPQPEGTRVTVQFAGSLDGVAFSKLSDPAVLETGTDLPQGIDLTALLPENSHFVRIRVTLASDAPDVSPRFGGFSLNYELANPAGQTQSSGTVSADPVASATVTVNSTVTGTTNQPSTPSSPGNLAATGVGDWVIVLMFLVAIGGALFLMRGRGYGGPQ
ncbi:hypothetical protein HY374_03900 [Candidatus Berkelbacteria bacterium]|nr:hypothetical protein [Candidatus Berkelbacteria bacterium]